jgi:Ca2+-binding EF-hand superfamily protein
MPGLKTAIVLGGLLAGLLAGGCASWQNSGSDQEFQALCASLDTNRDGKISQEEFLAGAQDKAQAETLFRQCDVNRRAFLTYEEAARNRWQIEQVIRPIPPVLRRK